MTDKPHDDDHNAVGHEDHDLQGEGAQAEAWQEDQPPVDDFHDQAETESMASAGDAAEGAGEHVAPAGKSGMKVMMGALAVGAVLIGGLLYIQFGAGAPETPLAVPIAQVMNVGDSPAPAERSVSPLPPPTEAAPPVEQAATVDPGTSPKTGEFDMSNIYNSNHPDSGTASTTPPPAPADVVPPVATANSAPVPEPVVADTNIPSPPPVVAATTSPMPVPVPVSTTTPVAEKQIEALQAKIDALQKALDQVTQQTGMLATRVDTAAQTPATSAVLENRVQALEQKLAAASVKTDVPAVMQEAAPVVKTEHVTKPKAKKTVAVKKHTKKKAPTSTHHAKPVTMAAEETPATSGQKWVLRAATPGTAWIAKGNTTQLTKVGVGDNVEGIGKVQSITQFGTGWLVIGSNGTIR